MLQQFVGRDLLGKNLISFPDVCPHEGQSLQLLCVKYDLDCPKVRLPLMIDNGSGHAAKSKSYFTHNNFKLCPSYGHTSGNDIKFLSNKLRPTNC